MRIPTRPENHGMLATCGKLLKRWIKRGKEGNLTYRPRYRQSAAVHVKCFKLWLKTQGGNEKIPSQTIIGASQNLLWKQSKQGQRRRKTSCPLVDNQSLKLIDPFPIDWLIGFSRGRRRTKKSTRKYIHYFLSQNGLWFAWKVDQSEDTTEYIHDKCHFPLYPPSNYVVTSCHILSVH